MVRVLIVDDEPGIRSVIEQTMLREGYDVLTAFTGADALKKLSLGRQIDLVITDLVMPEMDGLKLIAHIHKNYPGVKIIGMSGGGSRTSADDCLDLALRAGAEKTLLKPFTLTELVSASKELMTRPLPDNGN